MTKTFLAGLILGLLIGIVAGYFISHFWMWLFLGAVIAISLLGWRFKRPRLISRAAGQ